MINLPSSKGKDKKTDPQVSTNTESTQASASNKLVRGSMLIGMLVTASMFGYFGLMLLHKTILASGSTSVPASTPAIQTAISPQTTSSAPMDADDSPIIQNTTQSHQIALRFKPSDRTLDRVIDRIVQHCKENKFSTESLSISLVDLKTNERVGYHNSTERYPASVVKMFWLFDLYDTQAIPPDLQNSVDKMILKSDNNGASRVLDYLTRTHSTKTELSQQEFQQEKQKRKLINSFYQQKGYSPSLNISQKTFPITQDNIMEPVGFDKQLRGKNIEKPVRNKITTDDATLLMYEIINHPQQQMKKLLTRNTEPNFWQKQPPNPIEFNPVESFFGEGLTGLKTENIISKAGWTSASRQEVAYIKSQDGKTEYILTVFGDSSDYAKSKKIFPEISKLVYQEMRRIHINNR
jgi:hypothetical protein